jgi:hypothetical protein
VFVLFLKEIERKEIERKGEKMTISYIMIVAGSTFEHLLNLILNKLGFVNSICV